MVPIVGGLVKGAWWDPRYVMVGQVADEALVVAESVRPCYAFIRLTLESRMEERPGIGVGVMVKRGGELLLLRRSNVHGDGTWSTPGGHLEFGETPEECAVREVKEETSVDITSLEFIAVTNDFFEAERKHYITLWFQAAYSSGEARASAEYEMSELRWFKEDDLPSPLFLPLQNLLNGNCYPSMD